MLRTQLIPRAGDARPSGPTIPLPHPGDPKRCSWILSATVLAACSLIATRATAQASAQQRVAVIDEVWDIVEEDFYDPSLRGLDAADIRAEYEERARDVSKLLLPFEPTELVAALAEHKAANPDFAVERLHFFPLGGIKTNAAWTATHGGASARPAR